MSELRLLHYSAKPLGRVRAVPQQNHDPFKPSGLWVSVEGDDDWLSWCQAEGYRTHALAHVHQVSLRPSAHVKIIRGTDELDAFDGEFMLDNPSLGGLGDKFHAIDWRRVASLHQGIIIAPYVWSRRHTFLWYYGWDCASGCIWDPAAIAAVRCVHAPAVAAGG